jgi:hypothetical protein
MLTGVTCKHRVQTRQERHHSSYFRRRLPQILPWPVFPVPDTILRDEPVKRQDRLPRILGKGVCCKAVGSVSKAQLRAVQKIKKEPKKAVRRQRAVCGGCLVKGLSGGNRPWRGKSSLDRGIKMIDPVFKYHR